MYFKALIIILASCNNKQLLFNRSHVFTITLMPAPPCSFGNAISAAQLDNSVSARNMLVSANYSKNILLVPGA